jgi:cytoskeletal protein CcmA (bactofilin family)
MITADDGTRDLLPPSEADPTEIIGTETMFAGSFALAIEVPLSAIPSAAMQAAADLPPPSEANPEEIIGTGAMFAGSLELASELSHFTIQSATMLPDSDLLSNEQEDFPPDQDTHGQPASVLIKGLASSIEVSSTVRGGGGAGDRDDRGDGPDKKQPLPESDETRGGASRCPSPPDDILGEVDDGHSINVTQIAIVDQEASVMVSGYVGEVVARLHINQDLMMDQDVDISFVIDGDGHFALLLDQNMRIDQDVEIDLEIFDIDGVLYVDLFLHDSIEIEQDTTVDMRISGGSPGGKVGVNQDLKFDQEVDIDIDIEDELKERYIVKVTVESLQEVDAEQDVAVAIRYLNGEIDMDVDAVQMAAVEQQTIVQADFSLA